MPNRPDILVEMSAEEERLRHYNSRHTCPPPHSNTEESTPAVAELESRSMTQVDGADIASRAIQGEVDGPIRDTPSPFSASTEESPESDARSSAPLHDATPTSLQEYYTNLYSSISTRPRHIPNSTSSFLKPGSKFDGTQTSDRQRYDVSVEIKHVDMEDSFLCGYLRIRGLTDDHPTLTTYFEGEIVGNKHTFQTQHAEWGSNERVDMTHWARFPAWKPLAKQAKKPDFSFKNYAQRDYIFMRWKEYFLVPDHRVKTISGASFEGFYYICFHQASGHISGIYFHAKSEKYQQLELDVVPDHGCMSAFEFR